MDQISRFSVEKVIPSTLNQIQINELRISMQEAWSSDTSLGELAQCQSCSLLYSKESLFWWIPWINSKVDAVSDILDTLWMQESDCFCKNKHCGWKLYFPYGTEYNAHLRDYFASRINAILVLIRDLERGGRIVWFEWWYSWTLDEVFYEFKDHYGNFHGSIFRDAITDALWNMPSQFFVCASIGVDQFYRRNIRISMNILILLLKTFSESIPHHLVWITETDKRNMLHRLMTQHWARSLQLDTTEYWKSCLQWKMQPSYQSDILVHPSPIMGYQAVIRNISDTLQIKVSTAVSGRL